jgi:hypothetical protein
MNNSMYRLDINTMFKIREWERYKFMIDYEHMQASELLELRNCYLEIVPAA